MLILKTKYLAKADIENKGLIELDIENKRVKYLRPVCSVHADAAARHGLDAILNCKKKFMLILKTKDLVEADIENKGLIFLILKTKDLTFSVAHGVRCRAEKRKAQLCGCALTMILLLHFQFSRLRRSRCMRFDSCFVGLRGAVLDNFLSVLCALAPIPAD